MSDLTVDRLFLRQLAVPVIIGVDDHEKVTPQVISLDIETQIDAAAAALTDDIAATVNYAAIYRYVHEYLAMARFQLIETLAEKLSESLLQQFSLSWVRLAITKQPRDMPNVAGAGIEIERRSTARATVTS